MNLTNAIGFNNISDAQFFLDNLSNSIGSDEILDDNGANTKTSRFKFTVNMFTNINMQVKQKLKTSTQQYSVESVNSNLSGNVLG